MHRPRGAATPGWGGAFLTSCLQSWPALFRSESQLCLQSVLATYAPEHRSSAPAGTHTGVPPARLQGRGLGGSVCPHLPGWESTLAKRGAETFLATSRFCHLPFQTCPCKSSGWLFPPKLNKSWMLSHLSLGRRCSQKGRALDLPLCNEKQNLASFLD